MGKKRVYEIAKEYKVTNQEVIDILKKGNVEVTSPLSGIDSTGVSVLKKAFSKDKKVIAKSNTSDNAKKIDNARELNDNKNKNYNHGVNKNNNSKNRENVGKQYMQNKNNNQENTNEVQKKTSDAQKNSTEVKKAIPSSLNKNAGAKVSATTTSTQNRTSSSTPNRTSGNYQGRNNNSTQGRSNTSTQNRTSSSTPNRTSGNYQGRNNNSTQGRSNTSTQNRTSSSTQNRTSGNYQGRNNNSTQGTQNRTSSSAPSRTSGNYQGRSNNTSDKTQKTFTKPDAKKGQIKGQYASKNNKAKPKGNYAMRGSKPKNRRNNNNNNNNFPVQPVRRPAVKRPTRVEIPPMINVKKFADLIKCEVSEIIKHLFMLGEMVTINQNIDFDTAVLMGEEFGVEIGEQPPEEDPTEIIEVEDDPALRIARPPVVTVMGHVDHGKTSLLDVIRKENVTAREAGGITQHIGAYKVKYNDKPIVFLDTPGHEAFTSMRARGAQVTDIAILVVAADDGVMPQTIEAINHAKAAKVPIIVAINKMDREGANPEHVKQQLSEYELVPEDWGGDTIMVPVSAHMKTGIDELLEMILLVAEVQDFKANPNLPAHGTIVEAQLDKGRGPVATVLVAKGTLHVGDTIIAGTAYGKVRAMINDLGEKVKQALPSTPVEVLGLNSVPLAGDILDATEERIARNVAEKRIAKQKVEELQSTSKVSLEDIFERIQEGELKELNIVVKADVQGTIEALKQALNKIKNDEVKVVVVHAGVGAINESDVILASAANALVIGFNVRPAVNARKAAEAEKVDIRTYRVIYDALNDVQAAIKGMLAPKFKEVIQGRVEVRQLITISKVVIAGAYVLEGKVTSSSKVRVIRDGVVLQEDEIETLRRFKDDVKEVKAGFECGVTLEKYHDLREEDILEVYVMEEIKN